MKWENLPQIMVSMAQCRELPSALDTIVRGITQSPGIILARIWLILPGDICDTCLHRTECPGHVRCLHLAGSAGNYRRSGKTHNSTGGRFRRFPLGLRKIGRVAQSAEPLLISGIRDGEDWIADPDWIKREGIQSFAAYPLAFRDEILGVLALFDTTLLSKSDFDWLRVFADHAAVTIANARSFEEIVRLRARLEEENKYLRREVSAGSGVGELIGATSGLKEVMRQVKLVAGADSTVLITGESGTGKELIACAIHEQSPRRHQSMIKVNCGAIAESLFESEFFGHVKGAFTGAARDKPGRFELANRGTLFLDEVAEIPLAMQAKLLRALQEHEFERMGDTRPTSVDVRIVAATNRNLQHEVDNGRFRQDLYFRLCVFPIAVPPLRERLQDILPLATRFAQKTAARLKYAPPKFDETIAQQLLQYHWPGNVRELQNVIERAVILSEGAPLCLQLPRTQPPHIDKPAAHPFKAPMTREEMKNQERENIKAALAQTGGKVFGPKGAAALLGMKPTTLATRIKALGLK